MAAFDQRVIRVGPDTYDKVTAVRRAMAEEKHRQVTYAEAVDYLVTYYEETGRIRGTREEEEGR